MALHASRRWLRRRQDEGRHESMRRQSVAKVTLPFVMQPIVVASQRGAPAAAYLGACLPRI